MTGNKNIMKYLVALTLLMAPLFVQQGFSATWNSNVADGSFTAGASWSPATVPGITAANSINIGMNSGVQDSITYTGTISSTDATFTIQNGGVLHVTGSWFLGNNTKVIVQSGGKLIVDANITNQGGGGSEKLTVNSGGILDIGGFVVIKGGSGCFHQYDGTVTIAGRVDVYGSGKLNVGTTGNVNITGSLWHGQSASSTWLGTVEVENLYVYGGTKININNGTTVVRNHIEIGQTSIIRANAAPGGMISWVTAGVNNAWAIPNTKSQPGNISGGGCNSSRFVCISNGPMDTNTGGGCGATYATPGTSLNLGNCAAACVTPTVGGTVAASANVCTGVTTGTLTLSGHTGNVTKWQYSDDNWVTPVDVANVTTTLVYPTTTVNRKYRAVLQNGGLCATENSAEVTLTVDPTSVGGSITTDATICSGSNTAVLTLAGHTGTITKWQENVASGGWVDIGNGGSTTYTGTGLTQSTDYRAVLTSGTCAAVNSGTVSITVDPTSVGGTVTADATVCPLNNNETVTVAGHTGVVTRWEHNINGAGWIDIGNGGSNTYNYTNITGAVGTNIKYRAVITSGVCVLANSAEATATFSAALTTGSIGAAQTISRGATPAALTNTGVATGGGGFTYQWQVSTNNTTWANIGVAGTNPGYIPGVLNNDTWYRRGAIPTASCGTLYTASVKITVEVNVSCGVAPPTTTVINAPTGGTGSYTYVWQTSLNNADPWTTVSGATSATYAPAALSQTTYFRRGVSSGACGPIYTSGKLVTVTGSGGFPGGVSSGMLVWLKADAGTGNIGAQWEDQSGNGHHYVTVAGPTVSNTGDSASNFQPYVEIKSGGFNAPNGSDLGANYTVFAVGRKLATDPNGYVFDSHTGNHQFGFTTNSQLKKVELTSGSAAVGTKIDINQGNSGQSSHVHVYELLIYNSTLTTTEKSKIDSYLATKYGIKDDSDNYIASNSTITYNVGTNTQYNNDIIGLGKECFFHQKQSKTVDDSTKVYISTLAATNVVNAGTVTNDVSYLMVGHDAARMKGTAATSAEIPAGVIDGITVLSRIDREWKVTNTNFANEFTLKIETELNEAGLTMDDIVMLVDDDGNFSNGGTNAYYNTDVAVHGVDNFAISLGSFKLAGIGVGIIAAGATKFITIASKSAASPLPVELLSFNAVKNGNVTDVTWTTAAEINNDYFIIEKSSDGITWYSIGEIGGAGNSNSPINYSFIDNDGCNIGTCYYRLIQVDYDGKTSNSEVKSIVNDDSDFVKIKVYPVPTKDELNVSFKNNTFETVTVNVYDAQGQIVYTANLITAEGDNNFKLQVGTLSRGLYHIKILDMNGTSKDSTSFTKL